MLYDLAGEVELALEWLERGYEVRDPDMHYLGALWLSEELRSEPGYRDLLLRMDLPDVGQASTHVEVAEIQTVSRYL